MAPHRHSVQALGLAEFLVERLQHEVVLRVDAVPLDRSPIPAGPKAALDGRVACHPGSARLPRQLIAGGIEG